MEVGGRQSRELRPSYSLFKSMNYYISRSLPGGFDIAPFALRLHIWFDEDFTCKDPGLCFRIIK